MWPIPADIFNPLILTMTELGIKCPLQYLQILGVIIKLIKMCFACARALIGSVPFQLL